MRKTNISRTIGAIFTYIALIAVAIVFLFPCLWLILASFSESGSIYSFEGFFPSSYSFDSFVRLFTDTAHDDYPKWFLNTLKISVISCLIGTFLTILTAYCMSRYRFRSRKAMMKATLVLGMFPSFMSMTVLYLLMTQFDFINNSWGLILIYSAGAPMGYMVQKGFFDSIPNSIDDAAKIDGASNFQVFTKIALPLSKPMIVYTALTSFIWPWSDYILPKLLLQKRHTWTVAVGLMSLPDTEFSRFAAGSIFIAVPIVLLYAFLARSLVNGLSSGAVKE